MAKSDILTTTERYLDQENFSWPSSGRHILGHYDDESIFLYQAYSPQISESAVRCQSFLTECPQNGFSLTRMTWLKPNFLWMMYRSGWATKYNQERILALRVSRLGFEKILRASVSTSKLPDETLCQYRSRLKESPVRLQWDPDHLPNGERHTARKAIQIGIRGDILIEFLNKWITQIEDIPDFV
ncbi:hypothetical protein K7432_012263, partial [Basidiobolus ranarum]